MKKPIVSIIVLLLALNTNAVRKRDILYGGLAGYGAYSVVKNLFKRDSQTIYNITNHKNYDGDIKRLEQAYNELGDKVYQNSYQIEQLQGQVEKLEDRMNELEDDVVGKKLVINQLRSGLIVNTSIFDSYEQERIGSKQYNDKKDPRNKCLRAVNKSLAKLLSSKEFNEFKETNGTDIVNILIDDGRTALESMESSVSVNFIEQDKRVKFKNRIFHRNRFMNKSDFSQYQELFKETNINFEKVRAIQFHEDESQFKVYFQNERFIRGQCSNIGGGVCNPSRTEYDVTVETYDYTNERPDIVSLDVVVSLVGDKPEDCLNPISNDLFTSMLKQTVTTPKTEPEDINSSNPEIGSTVQSQEIKTEENYTSQNR